MAAVAVVGAGLAGLSAALHLLGAGRSVTVVEREDVPGGRAGREEAEGYLFDTGPTVLTTPEKSRPRIYGNRRLERPLPNRTL